MIKLVHTKRTAKHSYPCVPTPITLIYNDAPRADSPYPLIYSNYDADSQQHCVCRTLPRDMSVWCNLLKMT